DLVRFGADHGVIPRFIEFMPMGHDTHWEHADDNGFVSAQAIRDDLRTRWEVEPDGTSYGAGPAKYWRLRGEGLPDEGHPVGVIGAVTECFCADCNRMRLTSTGGLRACLADDREISVRAPLRTLTGDDERRAAIRSRIRQSLGGKKERHDFALEGDGVTDKPMTAIGG
ncbi:MAG: GTP 3',8-cyclase MoaA, partial [Bradymonadaceae bacterium]